MLVILESVNAVGWLVGAAQNGGATDVKEMSSMATGSCNPPDPSFFHSKTNLKVVPAYEAGMVTVVALVQVPCSLYCAKPCEILPVGALPAAVIAEP